MSKHPIEDSFRYLQDTIPSEVTLVAVSKTKSIDEIMDVYNLGQRDFGENKVQELTSKHQELPKDIHWHFIGHLQRNKVKYIAPFVYLIHSVDSRDTLKEISKRAGQNQRTINCLLQVSISDEESKFGMDKSSLLTLLDSISANEFPDIKITGFMGMGSNTSDVNKTHTEFNELKTLFDELKEVYSNEKIDLNILSMGMTGDFTIAIEEGSTMVRIGSLIFGPRN
jgi:pyridoxal phosphate enzyme (YggS family)